VSTALVLRREEHVAKLPHYYFSWTGFSKNRHKCEMLPLKTQQSGVKLLLHSDLRWGVFLEEIPRKMGYSKDYKHKQKEKYSYKTESWNVKDLESSRKAGELKRKRDAEERSVGSRCQ
jgi:hypothetical protein